MRKPIKGEWYKSSRSETGKQCVEICHAENAVGVRDSKNPGGPELWFTPEQWESFIGSGIWQG
ncbi:DUF397 domain-containing protein [Nocardia otitidiscaviarum]|uniref:DUF397 domain-containing protein n=1 Tax=Nocardia otitidiscaviarum TaxID=1823 RepID=UPI0004A738BA|nr:DUF397 domain-containing protein [Nocardia otitidiscaviarum]MBF6136027.1 DUF397 domain-containing protein [Nocardia otitidiscaviarum]MBF6483783.1 DUF397 domain-containing protein [Nocardia otitidiscaviarum]